MWCTDSAQCEGGASCVFFTDATTTTSWSGIVGIGLSRSPFLRRLLGHVVGGFFAADDDNDGGGGDDSNDDGEEPEPGSMLRRPRRLRHRQQQRRRRRRRLRETCSEMCETWENGVCEDGGPQSVSAACALGTDCLDCGARPLQDDFQYGWCADTCASARNGACEDGGPGATAATCEYDSDCADCGGKARVVSGMGYYEHACGAEETAYYAFVMTASLVLAVAVLYPSRAELLR